MKRKPRKLFFGRVILTWNGAERHYFASGLAVNNLQFGKRIRKEAYREMAHYEQLGCVVYEIEPDLIRKAMAEIEKREKVAN